MRRFLLCSVLLSSLAACGADNVWATDAQVAKFRYADPGPKTVTLFTVVNNRNGEGGHSALLINGAQRVVFDPAGTWWNPDAPERHDVHFGMSPGMLDTYINYHTRITWHTIEQTVPVTAQVAQLLIGEVEANGAAAKATCATTVSHILRQTPGFESIEPTWFPVTLMKEFAKLPGVKTRVYYDTDPDVNTPQLPAGTTNLAQADTAPPVPQ
jgi:hypothetical protein